MNIYCPNCGQLHSFSSQKPNFCIDCGTGMTTKASSIKQSNLEVEEDVGDESEIIATKQDVIPLLENLQIEMTGGYRKTLKLGDIARGGKRVKSEPMPKGKRVSKKEFLENFKKEAGSVREKHNGQ